MLPIAAWLLSAATVAAPVPSHLTISRCDAGEHHQFETATCAIEMRNEGDKPIKVSKGEAKFPWDHIDESVVVPPHGAAYLNAKVDLRNAEGYTQRAFRFATDEPGQAYRGSDVHAFVIPVLDQSKPTLDFGVVRYGEKKPLSASISLSSREVNDFRILGIESKPAWLDAELDKDGRTIHASLLPSAPWGSIHDTDFVKLKINAPQQPEAWVAIKAEVEGAVSVDGNPIDLGLMRSGEKHKYLIRLSSRSGDDFKVGTLNLERIKGKATTGSCVPAVQGCKLVHLDVANNQNNGKLEGVLNVGLPDFNRQLPIELVGFLVAKDVKIHKMDELMQNSAKEGAQSATSATPSLNLAKALENRAQQSEPPPPGEGPLLKWSVAHQAPIYGYMIYRADKEGGPFLRINAQVIRVVNQGSDQSGSYQWRDTSATKGASYWYQVGMIRNDGTREDLSGIQKVVAK